MTNDLLARVTAALADRYTVERELGALEERVGMPPRIFARPGVVEILNWRRVGPVAAPSDSPSKAA